MDGSLHPFFRSLDGRERVIDIDHDLLLAEFLDHDKPVCFALGLQDFSAASPLENGDSQFKAKAVTETKDKLLRRAGRCRFGVQAREQVVLRQLQVDIVQFGFDADFSDFRPFRFGLHFMGSDGVRRRRQRLGREVWDPVEGGEGRGIVLPQEHGEFELLLLDLPLRGNGDFAPALDFLIGLDDVQRCNGSRFGPSFDLLEAILRNFERFVLDVDVADGCDPIPELGGRCEEQVLPGLRDTDIRPGVSEFRALQFRIFRVDHQAFQEGKEPAQKDLLVSVPKRKIWNLGVADRLTHTRAVPESHRISGFDQGVIEADGLGAEFIF